MSESLVAWRDAAPADRERIFRERADRIPPQAADLYLLGCARLRNGDIPGAARAFGAAHHADVDIESAALLTFACLKASADAASVNALAGYVAATWREMHRPPLGRHRIERQLLDGLGGVPFRSAATDAAVEVLQCILARPVGMES